MSQKIPWKCPSCGKTRLLPAGYSSPACLDCRKQSVKSSGQPDKTSTTVAEVSPVIVTEFQTPTMQRAKRRSILLPVFLGSLILTVAVVGVWIGAEGLPSAFRVEQRAQPAPSSAKVKAIVRQHLSESLNDPDYQEVKWSEPIPHLALRDYLAYREAERTVRPNDGITSDAEQAAQAVIDDTPRREAASISIRLKYREKFLGSWGLSDYVFTVRDGKVIESLSMRADDERFSPYDPRSHFQREEMKELDITPVAPPPADLKRLFR